jgi:hypothetical protein
MTIPAQPLSEKPIRKADYANGFHNLTSVPIKVARSITQRARIFMEATDGKEFAAYVQQARIIHALVEDFHARNAEDPDARKKAAETFLKLTETMITKAKKK